MLRISLITFGMLGWAWYEMSGGANFVPGQHGVQLLAAAHVPASAPAHVSEKVARDAPAADLNAIIRPAVQPTLVRAVAAEPPAAVAVDQDKIAMLATPAVMSDAMPADEGGEGLPSIEHVVAAAAQVDYRTVTGNRVNLRGGPSTQFDVVTQLLKGEEVEVLDADGSGWLKLRALDGNDIGWMSQDFLTASN